MCYTGALLLFLKGIWILPTWNFPSPWPLDSFCTGSCNPGVENCWRKKQTDQGGLTEEQSEEQWVWMRAFRSWRWGLGVRRVLWE